MTADARQPAVTRPRSAALTVLPYVAAAAPFLFVLLRGFPAGDDWQLELARVAAYRHAWADGQAPPFWAPHLYAGYGSPIFLFYGQLVVVLASVISLVSGSLSLAFLLALAACAGVGVRALQLCAAASLPSDVDASAVRVGAALYLLNPYLLCDLLLRNAAAEYAALCFVPLAVYGLWRLDAGDHAGTGWLALGLALVIATHPLSAYMLCLVVTALVLVRRWNARMLLRIGSAGALALAATAYAWLPVIAYSGAIRTADALTGKFDFRTQFQPPTTLFDGTTEYSAGFLPLLAAGAALLAWRAAHRQPMRAPGATGRLGALLLVFCGLVLLQTRLAVVLWEHVPGMAYLQFPWRLMGPLALVAALLGSMAFAILGRELGPAPRGWLELAIWAACLVCSVPQLMRMQVVERSERAAFEEMLRPEAMRRLRVTTTAGDEYLPKNARWERVRAPASLEPIVSATDGLRIAVQSDDPREIVLTVRAAVPSEICLARWSYPFWRVRVDDRMEPVTSCLGGYLRVHVTPGRHQIAATLPMPAVRRWGLAISAATLLSVSAIAWRRSRRRRRSA